MTPEALSALSGLVLSLALSYIPGLNKVFDGLSADQKRVTVGGLLVLCALGSLAYTCQLSTECLTANWQQYVSVLIAALVANQSAYLLTKHD